MVANIPPPLANRSNSDEPPSLPTSVPPTIPTSLPPMVGVVRGSPVRKPSQLSSSHDSIQRVSRANSSSNLVGGGGPRPLPKFGEVAIDSDDREPDVPPRSPPIARNQYPALPSRDKFGARPASTPAMSVSSSSSPLSSSVERSKDGKPQPIKKDKMTRAELRQNVLIEIYNTEKDYIDDLETIISVFIIPLRTLEVVSEQVIYAIFSNVEVLINCNKEMVNELEVATDNGNKWGDEVQIGPIFTKLADYFKMYKVYSANQQTSLTTLEEQSKKNSQFKHYLEICHGDARCKSLFLSSFLIKPIQRVCKYPLLLRELIKYTPEEHPDYGQLQAAFEKINAVVANINEGQREAEGLQRILELQKLIDGIDTLVAPGRRLHKEEDLQYYKSSKTKHPEKRHVFFFSDLILLTVKKGNKFEHKMSIPLESCKLIVLADSQNIKNAFELSQKQMKHKCILSGETPEEINFWVKEIKLLIKEYQKKQLRELAEAKKKEQMLKEQMARN